MEQRLFALQRLSALSQNVVPGSQDLWSQMSGGIVMVVGGMYSITGESSTWSPMTVQACGGDKPGFVHAMGEPVAKAGQLSDPRTQLLNDVLIGQRKRVPR